MGGEARQKNARTVENCGGERHRTRPDSVHPQTTDKRGETEHEDADREGESDLRNRPSKLIVQRNTKNAPGVDRSEHDLEKHTSNSNDPTVGSFHQGLSFFVDYSGIFCKPAKLLVAAAAVATKVRRVNAFTAQLCCFRRIAAPSEDNVERDLAILASSLVPFGRKDRFWIGAGNFAHRDPAEAANKRADEK